MFNKSRKLLQSLLFTSFPFLGSTAYVLTEDGMNFKLWNASTGDMYDIQDVHCPLQGVSCLVTESNVSDPLRFLHLNSGFISRRNNIA